MAKIQYRVETLPEGHPHKYKVTVDYEASTETHFLFLTVNYPKRTEVFYGNCTVWYKRDSLGNLDRCESSTERWLHDLVESYKLKKYEKSNGKL